MSEEAREAAARRLTDNPIGDLADNRSPQVPGHESEEKLPPELSAMEAELAQLRPRAAGLDRERLIFLAGRESVGAQTSRGAGRWAGRWAWPAAFSAMTAVAATLLVMLLVGSQRPGEVRLVQVPVYVPAERPVEQPVEDSPDLADGQKGPVPFDVPDRAVRRERAPDPIVRGLFALVGMDWPSGDEEEANLMAADSYARLLDRVLEEGVDALQRPAAMAAPVAASESASAPMTYQELRDDLLGRPSPERRRFEGSTMNSLFFPEPTHEIPFLLRAAGADRPDAAAGGRSGGRSVVVGRRRQARGRRRRDSEARAASGGRTASGA